MAEENEERPWFVSKLWDEVSGFFIAMFSSVWSGFEEKMDFIGPRIANSILSWLGKTEERQWALMLDLFVKNDLMTGDEARELLRWKDLPTPLDHYMFFRTLGTLSSNYMDAILYGSSAKLRREILSRFTPERPPAESMVSAAFIAPEKTQEIRQKLRELGLDDADIDLMFLSRYRLYDETNIRTLWLRGVLSDDEMFMRMRELGYTDTRIKELVQGWSIIPGPADLFHLVAKEAFEPDMIERMGYADEFPVEQVEWLRKQGISEEWAKKYWYAHWETPSIQMGYEMLHREDPDRPGESIINREELDMLFRTVEIPPYWRDKLTKIAYAPYTRVDVRRMHDMGILTDQDLVQSYKDLGYDDEHAINMAKFTIRYNQQNDKELTKTQIMDGYKNKILSQEDTRALLMEIEYPEDVADYTILMADYEEAKSLQDEMLTNIQDRFQNNLADEFETRSKLGQLNLTGERIEILIDKWKIKKMVDVKVPSKTDLEKFLKGGIISKEEYRYEMQKLGYNTRYTDWFQKHALPEGGGK